MESIMITHEGFGTVLRMGNFLFKYAWSVAMYRKYYLVSSYPDYYLWQYLIDKPLRESDVDRIGAKMLRPSHWHWTQEEQDRVEDFINHNNTQVSLDFFFQSEKWFEGYENQVFNALRFKNIEVERIKDKYDYLFNSSEYRPTIGIGIRLGDFVGHGDFYQISPEWYIDCLKNFPFWEERKVVVFSDDIEKAKIIFKDYPFYYAEPNNTHTHEENFKYYHGDASEHLILGSLMDDWIIGNSTFSWWQAWLATYNKPWSKVFHCGEVFSKTGNMKDIDTSDYYCKNWIKWT